MALRNYFTAALRNLSRNKLYAAISIVGLSVGFSAAMLIALYVQDEFSYDQFIPGHERTFLLTETLETAGRTALESHTTPMQFAAWLKTDFPFIESSTRVGFAGTGSNEMSVRRGEIEANEYIAFADPQLFSVLPLTALAGDLKTALERSDGLVLTRRMARKYFGVDSPLGRTIEINRRYTMTVTAILEDLPSNTHLMFGIIASGRAPFSYLVHQDSHPPPVDGWNSNGYVYFRLKAGASADDLRRALPAFLNRYKRPALRNGFSATLHAVPLAEIHFFPDTGTTAMKPGSNLVAVRTMGGIGLLIVLVACINFVNLMTARAAHRATEVGIRKVAGAKRLNLINQFIGETTIYVAIGMMIAVVMVELCLTSFNTFLDRQITFDYWTDPALAAAILGLILLIGVLAGLYPAFVLSSFKPVHVLKSRLTRGGGSSAVRQCLVLLQFAILIGLILATQVVHRQAQYALNEGLRLDTDQVLLIATGCRSSFKDEVQKLAGVHAVACARDSGLNFGTWNQTYLSPTGQLVSLASTSVGPGYFDLYGFSPLAGRFFSREQSTAAISPPTTSEPRTLVVVNETALQKLGISSAQAAIGQVFRPSQQQGPRFEIAGVVADFSLDSIHSLATPTIYYFDPRSFQWLHVKFNGRSVPETLAAIDRLWKQLGGPRPIKRLFLIDEVQKLYLDIKRESQLLAAFTGVALFLACLGLFGLSAFMAERRTREIGIRKAMGAERKHVARLLLWDFTKPVLWANLVACPVAGYFMSQWLQRFAYRIDLTLWMFLSAGAAALLIALLTVTSHAWMVARAKPVMALRYE